jgi:hypothetical protein
VAAFASPAEKEALWRPVAALQVWALAVSLAALAWALAQLRRR